MLPLKGKISKFKNFYLNNLYQDEMNNPHNLSNRYTQQDICSHLTFEDAIQLREALGTAGLNCHIPINDPDDQIKILKGVTPQTVRVYSAIKDVGSIQALKLASIGGDIELVKLLLDAGVGVDASKPPDYTTALKIAAIYGNVELIRLLLSRGADINNGGTSGETPLMSSAGNGHLMTFRELWNAGADRTRVEKYGSTLLMTAVAGRNPEIVQLVLETNPDITARDQEGYTAIDWAIRRRDSVIMKLLVEKLTGQKIRNITIERENL